MPRSIRNLVLALAAVAALSLGLLAGGANARRAIHFHSAVERTAIGDARAVTRDCPAGSGAARAVPRGCPSEALRRRTTAPGPRKPLYWGAAIGDQLTGEQAPWDMTAVNKFEQVTGKPLSLIHFFSPFADCSSSCSYYKFPTTAMQNIREAGAIPFFSWSSQSTPSQLNEPEFQLGDIADGSQDAYIREFALAAKAWGHPFFLRFNWEMNGNWFPWSEGVNGNGPGEYVAAWRHVHDIFTEVGADNATWTWCPNVDPEHRFHDLASLYPGNEYVDWTCLDGYNWGSNPGTPKKDLSFSELFSSTYDEITETIAPGKPMVIGEVGATERTGDKAAWIAQMLKDIPAEFPDLRGLIWFDTFDDGMDWPLETSAKASNAFSRGISNPLFRANEYGSVETSPIQPPSA
jgi:hypothetical protein